MQQFNDLVILFLIPLTAAMLKLADDAIDEEIFDVTIAAILVVLDGVIVAILTMDYRLLLVFYPIIITSSLRGKIDHWIYLVSFTVYLILVSFISWESLLLVLSKYLVGFIYLCGIIVVVSYTHDFYEKRAKNMKKNKFLFVFMESRGAHVLLAFAGYFIGLYDVFVAVFISVFSISYYISAKLIKFYLQSTSTSIKDQSRNEE